MLSLPDCRCAQRLQRRLLLPRPRGRTMVAAMAAVVVAAAAAGARAARAVVGVAAAGDAGRRAARFSRFYARRLITFALFGATQNRTPPQKEPKEPAPKQGLVIFLKIKIINAPKNTKGGGGVCSLQASPLAVAAALVDTAPRFALLTILWKRTVADMRAPLAPSRQTPLALLVVTRDIGV